MLPYDGTSDPDEQFTNSRKIEKLSNDLHSIVQGPTESLRNFVSRFNNEKVSIVNYNMNTTISAFRKGLRTDSDLCKKLIKYPWRTIEDVLSKAAAQIKWEEDERNSQNPRLVTAKRFGGSNERKVTTYPRIERTEPRRHFGDPSWTDWHLWKAKMWNKLELKLEN